MNSCAIIQVLTVKPPGYIVSGRAFVPHCISLHSLFYKRRERSLIKGVAHFWVVRVYQFCLGLLQLSVCLGLFQLSVCLGLATSLTIFFILHLHLRGEWSRGASPLWRPGSVRVAASFASSCLYIVFPQARGCLCPW